MGIQEELTVSNINAVLLEIFHLKDKLSFVVCLFIWGSAKPDACAMDVVIDDWINTNLWSLVWKNYWLKVVFAW